MLVKDAQVGGAWAWHQDYGYWYEDGVLFPLLVSVSIAVDLRHFPGVNGLKVFRIQSEMSSFL